MTEQAKPPEIELNPEFRRALDLMENSDRHVFITGRAGTGKSTLLDYFRRHAKRGVVVLAPTGVAAVNVGGQTIHSFFGFKPDVTPAAVRKKIKDDRKNLFKKLSCIVIDEVSMVRADLLDCVDLFLRLNGPKARLPFGGVQMIFIGDLYQLPPVVSGREREIFSSRYATPYFFSAECFSGLDFEFVELEKIYRQKDDGFIRLLNAIRNRTATDGDLALLNRRVDPAFASSPGDFRISLTSTNDLADRVNEEGLARLRGRIWTAHGNIEGDFGEGFLPTAVNLKLKKGAQIMLLNNDSYGRWINGTIGRVRGFARDEEGEDFIRAELETGEDVEIHPYTWNIYQFYLEKGEIASRVVGSFTQYPVRPAFAVTIHKSQGKTFDRVIIDVGRGIFAHGQMYVALSRCTTLDGIVLRRPLRKSDILMDWRVVKFLTGLQYERAGRLLPQEERLRTIQEAIRNRQNLEIVYLKARDEKSRRAVRPLFVGEMEYNGRSFTGLRAYCLERREERTFNVARILEIRALPG